MLVPQLSRLKAQEGYISVLGSKALMWASYSEPTEEPCHAFGVEIESADLDPESVPALRTLVASCLGLVPVKASSSTVRLVHSTFRTSLVSSIRNGEGGLVEMQFTGDHPDADVSNIHGRPTPLSADCSECEVVLDFTDSGSGDSDLSTTESPGLSQSPIGSLRSLCPPRKTKPILARPALSSHLPSTTVLSPPPIFYSASLLYTLPSQIDIVVKPDCLNIWGCGLGYGSGDIVE